MIGYYGNKFIMNAKYRTTKIPKFTYHNHSRQSQTYLTYTKPNPYFQNEHPNKNTRICTFDQR